jgi:hypothetical protein
VKGKAETLRVFQVLREGQEAERFAEEAQLESTGDKGTFEVPRTKAAGYAPIEPSQPVEPAHPVAGPDDRSSG